MLEMRLLVDLSPPTAEVDFGRADLGRLPHHVGIVEAVVVRTQDHNPLRAVHHAPTEALAPSEAHQLRAAELEVDRPGKLADQVPGHRAAKEECNHVWPHLGGARQHKGAFRDNTREDPRVAPPVPPQVTSTLHWHLTLQAKWKNRPAMTSP